MARVVLFHHIQGLTSGVTGLADAWRDAGHEVHTPDLFEGHVFGSIEAGSAYREEIGFAALLERGRRSVDELAADVVYAGISMGTVLAEFLILTRPGARGGLMFESAIPVAAFAEYGGAPAWPSGVPFQIHGMDGDPFFAGEGDIEAAREMVAAGSEGELFLYPGAVHLFTDSSLGSYDPAAAGLLIERTSRFLARLEPAG